MKNKIKYLLTLLLVVDLFALSSCNHETKVLSRETYEDVIRLHLSNKTNKEVTLVPFSHYFGTFDGYELITLDLGITSMPSINSNTFDIPKKNHYYPLIYKDHKMTYLTNEEGIKEEDRINLEELEPSTIKKIEKVLNEFDYHSIYKSDPMYLGYYNSPLLEDSKRDKIAFLCSYDFDQTYNSSVSYLNVKEQDYGKLLDYDVSLYRAYKDDSKEKAMKKLSVARYDFLIPRSYDFVLSNEESGKTLTLLSAYQDKLITKEQVEEVYNKHKTYYNFYYEYNSFLNFA